MNEKTKELCAIVGANPDLMQHNHMTTDEILECINCSVDEEGEIIDNETRKLTGIWYEEIEY